MIDAAMLRPGRLDKLLYVQLPKQAERLAILNTIARKMPLSPDVDLAAAAADKRTEGFSGADLAALMREAAMCALKESLARERSNSGGNADAGKLVVGKQHLNAALRVVLPSVSAKDEKRYEVMASRLRQSRAKVTEDDVDGSSAPPLRPIVS
jgi:ribosome biogenesis ATPase